MSISEIISGFTISFANRSDIVFIFLILSLLTFLSRLTIGIATCYTNIWFGKKQNLAILDSVVKLFFGVIGLLIIFDTFGISISPLLTAFGIGAFSIALALQPTLTNFFLAIYLLATKDIQPGNMYG